MNTRRMVFVMLVALVLSAGASFAAKSNIVSAKAGMISASRYYAAKGISTKGITVMSGVDATNSTMTMCQSTNYLLYLWYDCKR